MAEINWICSFVLKGFVAPASDAPIKVVKVYRQLCNSLTFNRPVLAPLGRTGGGNDKRGTNTVRDS